MAWRWYVYEITRGETVVYVGKGTGKRAAQSATKHGGVPIRIAYFEHEEHSYAFERQRIKDRLSEGHPLRNISHGNAIPWWRRTDTRAYALEALQDLAWRIGTWIRAGRLPELARKCRISERELISLHQAYGG